MRFLLVVLVAFVLLVLPCEQVHAEPREQPPKDALTVNPWDAQPAILLISTHRWNEALPKVTKRRQVSPSRSKRSGNHRGYATTEECIKAVENGGSYERGSNSSHTGRYQFSRSTWIANGGDPATWESATPEEQDAVFATTVARNGYRDWAPYDGC